MVIRKWPIHDFCLVCHWKYNTKVCIYLTLHRLLFHVHVNTFSFFRYVDSKGKPTKHDKHQRKKKRHVNGKEMSQARQTMCYLWTSLIVVLRHLKERP